MGALSRITAQTCPWSSGASWIRACAPLLRETQKRPFIPSVEQKRIAKASRSTNVMVSARPGSGKTATVQAIIEANPTARILCTTYSRQLRNETNERLKKYPTCATLTFHQSMQILFGTRVPDDLALIHLRRSGVRPEWTSEPPDIIVFDELQDCTPILYWTCCMLIESITHAAGGRAPRLVVLGDERQTIYAFREADARYLTLCISTLGPLSPYPWTSLHLNTSFRLSHENAQFVDKTFLGGEGYLTGSHTGPKPTYIHGNLENTEELAEKLVPFIQQYGHENTAILSPFVRAHWEVKELTNLLSEKYHLGVALSTLNDMTLDDDVLRGKICVSTFHQFKGRERPLIIVYGADQSYFRYVGGGLSQNTLPNVLYVACTRATKKLVILHSAEHGPLPCAQLPRLRETTEYMNLTNRDMKECAEHFESPKNRKIIVSDLARHMSVVDLKSIVDEHLQITQVAAASGQPIHAVDKTMTNRDEKYFEAVSDLNGTVALAAYELKIGKSLVSLGYGPDDRPEIPKDRNKLPAWLCRRACEHDAKTSGYKPRNIQMAGHLFSWLRKDFAELTSQRIGDQIKCSREFLDFEVRLEKKGFAYMTNSGQAMKADIHGFADIVVDKGQQTEIWEVKFKTMISLCDIVQLATYGYLWHHSNAADMHQELPSLLLYSVRTDEKMKITAKQGISGLESLIQKILAVSSSPKVELSDEQFLKDCDEIRQEVQKVWDELE